MFLCHFVTALSLSCCSFCKAGCTAVALDACTVKLETLEMFAATSDDVASEQTHFDHVTWCLQHGCTITSESSRRVENELKLAICPKNIRGALDPEHPGLPLAKDRLHGSMTFGSIENLAGSDAFR